MGYLVKSDGVALSYVKVCGRSVEIVSDRNRSPIVLESRVEADLLAAFLTLRFPCNSPYSVHETVKVVSAPKEV